MHGFAVKTLLKVDQNQNKNITYQYGRSQAYVFEACTQSSTYVAMCNSIVFKCFSVDIRKRTKTLVWVDTNRSMRFRWQHFWKRISVDRVLKNDKNQIDSDGVLTFYLAFA